MSTEVKYYNIRSVSPSLKATLTALLVALVAGSFYEINSRVSADSAMLVLQTWAVVFAAWVGSLKVGTA
jgi:hypothetical protein